MPPDCIDPSARLQVPDGRVSDAALCALFVRGRRCGTVLRALSVGPCISYTRTIFHLARTDLRSRSVSKKGAMLLRPLDRAIDAACGVGGVPCLAVCAYSYWSVGICLRLRGTWAWACRLRAAARRTMQLLMKTYRARHAPKALVAQDPVRSAHARPCDRCDDPRGVQRWPWLARGAGGRMCGLRGRAAGGSAGLGSRQDAAHLRLAGQQARPHITYGAVNTTLRVS